MDMLRTHRIVEVQLTSAHPDILSVFRALNAQRLMMAPASIALKKGVRGGFIGNGWGITGAGKVYRRQDRFVVLPGPFERGQRVIVYEQALPIR